MYSFHLEGRQNSCIAQINYSEEEALGQLYEKKIPFVLTLFDRYYEDYRFCEGELKQAQIDLMKQMNPDLWMPATDENEKQLYLVYKLYSIVSYALYHRSNLLGSGD